MVWVEGGVTLAPGYSASLACRAERVVIDDPPAVSGARVSSLTADSIVVVEGASDAISCVHG